MFFVTLIFTTRTTIIKTCLLLTFASATTGIISYSNMILGSPKTSGLHSQNFKFGGAPIDVLPGNADHFRIYWNAQTQKCRSKYGIDVDVKKFGIIENENDGWKGEKITIFTQSEMGYYPHVLDNGTVINRGVPQAVNMALHLEKVKVDVQRIIPDKSFNGLAIIDWEGWRPTWERNWDHLSVYKNISKDLVRKKHPEWSDIKIERKAKEELESSGRQMILLTVKLAQQIRPRGKWGFYHYSDCYKFWYPNESFPLCSMEDMDENNRLFWMFEQLSGTYPSCYVYSKNNFTHNYNYIYGQIKEQIRLAGQIQQLLPIFPYGRFRYNDLHPFQESFYKMRDIISTITLPALLGVNGLVLWDDHYLESNKDSCQQTESFVKSVIGPLAKSVINSTQTCAKNFCGGQRRCFYPPTHATKFAFDKVIESLYDIFTAGAVRSENNVEDSNDRSLHVDEFDIIHAMNKMEKLSLQCTN